MEQTTSPVIEEIKVSMTFPEAIAEMTNGACVTRLGWPEGEYGFFLNDFLSIHKDGKDHIWQVSMGDAVEQDFILY